VTAAAIPATTAATSARHLDAEERRRGIQSTSKRLAAVADLPAGIEPPVANQPEVVEEAVEFIK
jgi:hypothetical protein